MRIVKAKNLQDVADVYMGKELQPGEYYQLTSELEVDSWGTNEKVNQHIWFTPAKLGINDGTADLSPMDGDKWLKGNAYTAIKMIGKDGLVNPVEFDSEGFMRVSAEARDGTKYNVFTHNWCDKCTWYQESTKATDETLADSGNGLTFNSAHGYWIDMTHGRITDEDRTVFLANEQGKWIPVIKVDDVIQT